MNYNIRLLTKNLPWINCYEGEGEGGGGEGGGGEGGNGEGGTATKEGAGKEGKEGTSNGADDDKPTISQKKLNQILAEEKRKHKATIDKQVQELEGLKKSKGLTEREKESLQARIEELNNSLLSREQLTEKEKKKLAEEHKKQLDSERTEKEAWRNRFQTSTIERTIMDEALKQEAFNPNQIVALLRNSTRLVEVLDNDGTPVPNEFAAKVRLQDTDKEGKPVTLELTVSEAIKRLKDRTDEYGNLFKSNLNGGLGNSGGVGRKQDFDPKTATAEQYRQWRNKRLGRKNEGNQS